MTTHKNKQQALILSAKRSAIGRFGGSLKEIPPITLGTHIAIDAIEQSQIPPQKINHAVIGNVIHTEPRDMYSARCIAINAGLDETAPALTVNRLCGSGLQAIVSGTQLINLGDAETILAGGTETMSRSGHLIQELRWGKRFGDAKTHDMMLGALHDPFGLGHMGITAENIAKEQNITRKQQDAFAIESQRRAAAARDAGYFKQQISPIEIAQKHTTTLFQTDEYIRDDATLKDLSTLPPAFQKDGSVTAGNASGINDGAAMLVLGTHKAAEAYGSKPIAKIIGYGFGGVAPRVMGLGPIPASKMALENANLKISDLDIVESNEAFAAQALAVSKNLGLPDDIVNPNGGAIALGHPVGATGAIIMTKLVHELHRRHARYGMATMCIGGGQGISIIVDTKI